MEGRVKTVSEKIDDNAADLDQALEVAGIGRYNLKYSLAVALLLIAAIVELIGLSLVLPAAVCDLQMTDSQRGLVASIPYIGIILTSYPWGYLVDTCGRKKTVIYSSLAAGLFSVLSGFMPDLTGFAICKLLTSLCLACPSAVPYTFIGEILPSKYRDIILSVTNALQITGTALVPLLAWAILPLDFRISFGLYIFRPWRLLTMIYASLFFVTAGILSFGPESPKYLVSQERYDEALAVLQKMYAGNKRKSPEEYPIKKLIAPPNDRSKGSFITSLKEQTVPLLKWSYLKWLLLNGFLLFGIFSVLNGLYMWVPDVLNRVLTGGGEGKTACQVIADRLNQTSTEDAECDDSIDEITFLVNSVAQISCAVIALVVSSTVKFIGKKNLLLICFFLIGTFAILINVITNDVLFAVLMSSFPIMALAMGPVNAYAVEIFPTHLRGMAVSLSMMLGRTGSIIGTNVAGLLINNACETMFYLFGGLLLLCGVLVFLLPKSRRYV
ncbi:putative transporter SVOPL [Anticarsia gemmatalis]|uniref:putative transporter SVOPL n=1 Tax=Anticarsia gemmatalis TaxID=129554 RepID=UPI003F76A699